MYYLSELVLHWHWRKEIEAWKPLVHVYRRWRSLVFGSPRYLNLRLFCTPKTPVRDKLDIWPAALHLVVECSKTITDNIIAALGQSNRVREVKLRDLAIRQLEEALAAIKVPFPELKVLHLSSPYDKTPRHHSFTYAFPIHSWADLPHVYKSSPCVTSRFRDCQIFSCLLLTLLNLGS